MQATSEQKIDFGAFSAFDGKEPSWPYGVAKCLIECAVLSYSPRHVVKESVASIDSASGPNGGVVTHFEWFDAQGGIVDTQAFGCVLERDVILAFRGTEGLRDVLSDVTLNRKTVKGFDSKAEIPGVKAHDGFRRCLDAIWSEDYPGLKKKTDVTIPKFLSLHGKGKRIWLTGHSLGGALATLAAARIALTPAYSVNSSADPEAVPCPYAIAGLYTIGSPRVLNIKGAKDLMAALGDQKIYRIVKSIDPVPLVPRVRYRHVSGTRVFITSKGKLVVGSDRWKRWLESFLAWVRAVEDAMGTVLPGQHAGLGAFISDHASQGYLRAVKDWNPENKHTPGDILGMMVSPIKVFMSGVVGGGAGLAGVDAITTNWQSIKNTLGMG